MSIDIATLQDVPGLVAHAALLEKWQARINLVGPATLGEMWQRHFLDSAQLRDHIPDGVTTLADLGSGAGFPGLVLAMLRPDIAVQLLESDQRKCAFLATVAREAGVAVKIHNRRIEQLPHLGADLITARALAPLERLLALAVPHLAPGGQCLFLKGQNIDVELTEATKCWKFEAETWPSQTDPQARILRLSQIAPASD